MGRIYISYYSREGGTPVDREEVELRNLIPRTETLTATHVRYELHDGSQLYVPRPTHAHLGVVTLHVEG